MLQQSGSLLRRAGAAIASGERELAMAMLAFLRSDPVVGAKWDDIQFKSAVGCLAANGLKEPEDLANGH